jgi:hypothetical protein
MGIMGIMGVMDIMAYDVLYKFLGNSIGFRTPNRFPETKMTFRKSNDISDLTYNSQKSYDSQGVSVGEGEGGRHRQGVSLGEDEGARHTGRLPG